MWGKSRIQALALAVAFGLGTGIASESEAASMACDDVSKRIDKAGSSLSMQVDGGRGSLFVNGRYAGTAPLSSIPIPAGPNDIQVRDGAAVISSGVLWVPKSAAISVTVRHP
jgi:hypothetical protein